MEDKDISKEMTSNERNSVFSQVTGIKDNDTSEGEGMGNMCYTCLPLPRIPRIKQEICKDFNDDELKCKPLSSVKEKDERSENVEGGKSTVENDDLGYVIHSISAGGYEANGWTFKVLNVQSRDLQVVASGNFNDEVLIIGDGHQDDTRVQSGTSDIQTTEKITPAELGKSISCEMCSFCFDTASEYYEHLKTHCSETLLKCPLCQVVYPHQMYLYNHLLNHANLKDSKRICKYCKKIFSCPSKCTVHEYTHTGVKPYNCTYCNKAFTKKSHLLEHDYIHTGDKPFKCAYCNKTFTRKHNLMEHERIHTGIKPFQCTYCNMAFTQQGSQIKHERIHTGVKPFKCTYCNKAFTQRCNLDKHKRIHTSGKF